MIDLKGPFPKRRVITEHLNFTSLALDLTKDWSIVNEPTLKGIQPQTKNPLFENWKREHDELLGLGIPEDDFEDKSENS